MSHPQQQEQQDALAATFSVMTYNLWKTDGAPTFWDTRRAVLLRQLRQLDPDVLLVQELCPEIAACVLEALPGHRCITHPHVSPSGNQRIYTEEDEEKLFEGWQQEGNIFFRSSLFRPVQWGHECIGQEEQWRRLFWVRLQLRQSQYATLSSPSCLFSTAHFTWQGHPREIASDVNLRKQQTKRTIAALDRLQTPDDAACFFGGDLNESFWPKRLLEGAGFKDCFSALSLPCRPTHPMRPTLAGEDCNADSALDWIFARGMTNSQGKKSSGGTDMDDALPGCEVILPPRPLCATVVRDSVGLSSDDPHESHVMAVQPSDHAPVLAVYRIATL